MKTETLNYAKLSFNEDDKQKCMELYQNSINEKNYYKSPTFKIYRIISILIYIILIYGLIGNLIFPNAWQQLGYHSQLTFIILSILAILAFLVIFFLDLPIFHARYFNTFHSNPAKKFFTFNITKPRAYEIKNNKSPDFDYYRNELSLQEIFFEKPMKKLIFLAVFWYIGAFVLFFVIYIIAHFGEGPSQGAGYLAFFGLVNGLWVPKYWLIFILVILKVSLDSIQMNYNLDLFADDLIVVHYIEDFLGMNKQGNVFRNEDYYHRLQSRITKDFFKEKFIQCEACALGIQKLNAKKDTKIEELSSINILKNSMNFKEMLIGLRNIKSIFHYLTKFLKTNTIATESLNDNSNRIIQITILLEPEKRIKFLDDLAVLFNQIRDALRQKQLNALFSSINSFDTKIKTDFKDILENKAFDLMDIDKYDDLKDKILSYISSIPGILSIIWGIYEVLK